MDIRLADVAAYACNAIPSDASARIALHKGDLLEVTSKIHQLWNEIRQEHLETDPDCKIELVENEATGCTYLSEEDTRATVNALYLLKSGCINRNPDLGNVPVTSYNLESVNIANDQIVIQHKPKSAIKTKMLDLEEQDRLFGTLLGFDYEVESRLVGHQAKGGSPLYLVYSDVYKEVTGKDVQAIGVHYVNEIGTFLEKMPWLDVILVTATHYFAHTPDEKLDLASFDRNYVILKKILERI